jgi:hypothetical protein
MKIYVTFGQSHIHKINGIVIDKDCIVEFEVKNHKEGREKAFGIFGDKFFTTHEEINSVINYFPRGIIKL